MKIHMKTISLFIAVAIFLSTLSSCKKAGTELAELMIIQGIGIDASDNGYKVTVEILNNEQSGTPGGEGTGENKTKIYSAEGETVAQALRTLITKSGNEPLFAHNRVIVIGDGAANRRLSDIIDFFIRDYDSRASQLLCVAKNIDAERVIRAKLLDDTVKSEILENMLEESYSQSLAPRVRIVDAVNIMKSETAVLCIPAVSVTENGENEDYKLNGCALYGRDETLSSYISEGDAEGMAFLTDNIKEGYFSTELMNGQRASFVINKGKTKFDISQSDGVLKYHINIHISCDMEEVYGAEYFSTDDDFFQKIEESIEKAIIKRCENTITVLKGEHGGDAVRYGDRLRLYDYDEYKSLRDTWQEQFKEIETIISVDVTIRRIGEETFHSQKQ